MNTFVNALREARKYIAEISAAADKLIVIADGYDDPDCTDARVALRAVLDRAAAAMAQVVFDDTAIRADAAEVMVCELREKLKPLVDAANHRGWQPWDDAVAALAGTADIAGRWVSRADFDDARLALAEISELVGPGGDDTPFGRVESLMSRLTGERDEAVAEAHQRLVVVEAERDAVIARAEQAEGALADAQKALDEARAFEIGAVQASVASQRRADEAERDAAAFRAERDDYRKMFHAAERARDEAIARAEKAEAVNAANAREAEAECLRLHADAERYRHALDRINAARNSIVQRQAIDWSSHIYPIVAALEDAGIKGDGYDVTRAKALTEIEAIKQRIAAEAVAERDAARAEAAALRVVVDAARYQKASGMFVSAALEMALAALHTAPEDIR